MILQSIPMRSKTLTGLLLAAVGIGALLPIGKAVLAQSHPAPAASTHPPQTKASQSGAASSDYVDPGVCANCHQEISQSYSATGMGRSLQSVRAGAAVADFSGRTVDHQASGMHYTMLQHDGKLFMRRSQIGYQGKVTNVVEEQVDYVIGSGNHARTFLHRNAQGKLIVLPVSWYTEAGGYWAMSPGYDRRDQEDLRRALPAECMFCHNAYPQPMKGFNPTGVDPPVFPKSIAQGIDCQRCHGPGGAHVAAVLSGASTEVIRQAIVNPAKLNRDRQLDVCMQCHLETSSSHMPNEIRRFDRKVFSYRPGQPLGDYKLYFDPDSNRETDRFEIAHAAYRLRMSACFQKSQMTCLTCHDPHKSYRGPGSTEHYVALCQGCHQSVKHTASLPQDRTCLDCHMPKRRTDDAVHVVMTDHYIQRVKPDRDLRAQREESTDKGKGGTSLYYPARLQATGESELYLALAEVRDGATGEQGIARLQKDIQSDAPTAPEFYFELGHAYLKSHDNVQAVHWYEEALRRRQNYPAAAKELAVALLTEKQASRAAQVLRQAVTLSPSDDELLADLGNVYLRQGRVDEAQRILMSALRINRALPGAENLLGVIAVRQRNSRAAETWFRAAILDNPSLAEGHRNLASLLSSENDYAQAAYEYSQAIAADERDAASHHGYGLMLELTHSYDHAAEELQRAVEIAPNDGEMHSDLADLLAAREQLPEAEAHYESAIRLSAPSADLHASLGSVLAAEGKQAEAILQFQKAIGLKPDLYQAHLEYAALLAKSGDLAQARVHALKAAQSPDSDLRNAALGLLRELGD